MDDEINIRNSFKFGYEPGSQQNERVLNNAYWLADRLNDLVEEYHAPGTPRRERRLIEREFKRVLTIFRKYCIDHCIYPTSQKCKK